MTVNYRLLKNYGKPGTKTEYRAVTIEKQTVGMESIAQQIQQNTTFTSPDIIGTIAALKDEVSKQLMSGNTVHLSGLGYFSLAVKGEVYEDARTHHRRLNNPTVRTVNFRPDTEMMDKLTRTKFENVTYREGTSSVPTDEQIKTALDDLFSHKPVITVADLRDQLYLSPANAYRVAARLETEGKLCNINTRYRKLYTRGQQKEG